MRSVPSGASASAIGPMPPWLGTMPVANAWAAKGRSTLSNSLGRVSGAALGIPCSAAAKSGLLEGCGKGAGAMPKFGGVVPGTVGSDPRFTAESSAVAFTPGFGASRFPATSVASAKNS